MIKTVAAIAGALSLALLASTAQAAPLGTAGNASQAAAGSDVVQVHGLHSACRRDGRGWHRSYIWGRQSCYPPHRQHRHHHHGKKHWKKR
jgi:hypothetical protein